MWRRWIFLLFIGAALSTASLPASAQDALEWSTDLAAAQRVAAQTNRLLLVHFWGTWCPPCMKMEREVFTKPGLGTVINPYFVPVKIQVEQNKNEELVKQFGVEGFPCDIIMTPQGQVVSKSVGAKTPADYLAMLNQTLVQARTSGGGRPGPVQPAAHDSPTSPGASTATVATAAAAAPTTGLSDDRYAYYFQSRGAAAATPASAVGPPAAATSAPTSANTSAPTSANTSASSPSGSLPARPTPNAYGSAATGVASTAGALPGGSESTRPATAPVANPVAAAVPATPPLGAPTSMPSMPSMPSSASPAGMTPAAPPTPSSATSSAGPPTFAASQSANVSVAATTPNAPAAASQLRLPPGSPPLALDGYCPVTVTEKMVWKRGDVRFGAIHRGRTYLFASAAEQTKFLAAPDRYSPIISGNDPVVALEQGKAVSGKREHGLMYDNRMMLFSSKETYDKFCKDSKRYSQEMQQAFQIGGTLRR